MRAGEHAYATGELVRRLLALAWQFRGDCLLSVLVAVTMAFGLAVRAQPTHPWEVVEITLEASGEHTNAYVQGLPDRNAPLAQVTLTGTSGAARDMRYTLAAFRDGGKTWKARFAPPAPGEWSWSSDSKEPGLAAVTGKSERWRRSRVSYARGLSRQPAVQRLVVAHPTG
jgi:hypothetical protein